MIIPAKNEEESLIVLDELKDYKLHKIVVIPEDDKKTYEAISDYDCEIIFQKNGFGAALIEGLKNSKTLYSCIFNADGSFDPKDLPKMYNLLSDNNNNLDYVFTSRYSGNGGSDDDTLITKIEIISSQTYAIYYIKLMLAMCYIHMLWEKHIVLYPMIKNVMTSQFV